MAETLRSRIETIPSNVREHLANVTAGVAERYWHTSLRRIASEMDALSDALALPDDPSDAKLRAFAGSMTEEKWEALLATLSEEHGADRDEPDCPSCKALAVLDTLWQALQQGRHV